MTVKPIVQKFISDPKFLLFIPVFIIKFLLGTIGWALTLALCFYTQSPVFDFPETTPFGGDKIFNPYQQVKGQVVKANFHAHSKAWGGLTNGHNSSEELLKSYREKGYAFAGISNYFATDPLNEHISVYEHGINLMKSHKLAINPSSVVYFDYPLLQNTSQKQDIINRLRDKDALVVLAHPNFMNGHTEDDMRLLSGYHFTEVLNHYRTSEKEWDTALQSGRLSWIMANDDSHDIHNEPTHRIWNEVYIEEATDNAMVESLEEGKNYGIDTKNGVNDLSLVSLIVLGDSVFFDFGKSAKKVRVILDGQDYQTINTSKGGILFPGNGQYVRFIAASEEARLYTNPLIRYGEELPLSAAGISPTLNYPKTYMLRVLYGMVILTLITILTGFRPNISGKLRLRRKRRPVYS